MFQVMQANMRQREGELYINFLKDTNIDNTASKDKLGGYAMMPVSEDLPMLWAFSLWREHRLGGTLLSQAHIIQQTRPVRRND